MSDSPKLNCVDIDTESGDILVGIKANNGGSFVVAVSEKDYKDRTTLALSGENETIQSIQSAGTAGLELDFFYEAYPLKKSFVDLPFSIEVSNFTSTAKASDFDINNMLLLNATAAQTDTDVFIPNTANVVSPSTFGDSVTKLEVWAKDANGIKTAQLDSMVGYFIGNELDTSGATLLPVFSWEVAPLLEMPRLLVVDDQNNISSYLLSTTVAPAKALINTMSAEHKITAASNPLAASENMTVVGGLYDQYFYVSNDSSCVKINTDTFNIVAYFENELGAAVVYKSMDGQLWGLAQPSGKIYKVVSSTTEADVAAALYEYHHQLGELYQSDSSGSSSG